MLDGKLIALSGLVVSTCYVASEYHTSFIFDRVLYSAAVLLCCCGFAILLLARFLSADPASAGPADHKAILLEERRASQSQSRGPSFDDIRDGPRPYSLAQGRKLRLLFLLLVSLICVRVVILFYVLRDVQCAGQGYQYLLPFALALCDYVQKRRYQSALGEDDADADIYGPLVRTLIRSRYALVGATLLLGVSAMLHLSASSTPTSTYICPRTLPPFKVVPFLQILTFAVDLCLLLLLSQFLDSRPYRRAGYRVTGWACIISSGILAIAGVIIFLTMPEHRFWILHVPDVFHASLVKFTAASFLLLCSAARIVNYFDLLTTSFLILFFYTYSVSFGAVLTNFHPFPPISYFLLFLSMLAVFLAVVYFWSAISLSNRDFTPTFSRNPKPLLWTKSFLGILFLTWTVLWVQKRSQANFHPIDLLIMAAGAEHEEYVKSASSSKTLDAAASLYLQKYGRNPPPNFDKWYSYAESSSAVVVDDFDNIYYDLLPFWSLSPAEIRARTWEMIANPKNNIGGIQIRNGSCHIVDNVPGTHRWMLEGVIRMIDKFGEYIPDMDLAFNLNDEARIAVPYDKLKPMRKIAMGSERPLGSDAQPNFSKGRLNDWQEIPEDPIKKVRFQDESFLPSFYTYGSIACPASSASRKQLWWDKSKLCTRCAEPHSIGQFLSNWTLSASPCHQPDIANLHGFYISPGTFRNSHELLPVFSQSKPFGFNDIVYPSAWNYVDKVKYEPTDKFPDKPFFQKQNTLYWRGASSEGVTTGTGAWKGMGRQRFIHVLNNLTEPQPLLLPYPVARTNGKLAYAYASPTELKSVLHTDVGFVGEMVRCVTRDCKDQAQEFAFAPREDFQKHWSYAYLYDGDGAGFSGRFLPFLLSHSLPFKTALFREWYEGRLTPWLHFVPLDLRLQGLWGTFAYFAGFEGKLAGKWVKWERRNKEAEMIAERGRDWAEKVLRKEDMELYFFRLLLEWGRLTDDRRDVLGFATS